MGANLRNLMLSTLNDSDIFQNLSSCKFRSLPKYKLDIMYSNLSRLTALFMSLVCVS